MVDLVGTVLAVEEEGGGGGLELILPETSELIWGAVSFVIVLVVLWKVAFPKLKEAVEKREQEVARALKDSEDARTEAQKLLDEYKRQLGEARAEANRVIEEARQQAEDVRKDIIAKAEKDAEQIVSRAEEQIAAERNRTVQDLQGQLADLSIELAEKIVGRSLDDSAQREFVDAYIKEVSGMPGNGKGRG